MTQHILPVSAWCPIDETGALQVQCLQYFKHDILVPAGRVWRMVRVIVEPMETYEERDECVRAIDALPDAVACALLGSQADEWAGEDAT